MMEPFYPEELKELVRQLAHSGDLNLKPLDDLDNIWHGPLCLSLFFAIPAYLQYGLLTAIFVFPMCAAVMTYSMFQERVHKFILPYSDGEQVAADVNSAVYEFNPSFSRKNWHIYYIYKDKNAGQMVKGSTGWINKEDMIIPCPKEGDRIVVYTHPYKKKKSTMFIPNYFRLFCLSKSRLRSEP